MIHIREGKKDSKKKRELEGNMGKVDKVELAWTAANIWKPQLQYICFLLVLPSSYNL